MKVVRVLEDFDQSNRIFHKGETYEVFYESDSDYNFLIKDSGRSWEIDNDRSFPPEIQRKYAGMRGWTVRKSHPVTVDDKCGACTSRCRSDKGKCVFYSE